MKKILVTGVNSYVGNSFAEWVEQYPDEYEVDRISVRDDKWKEIDLSVYDSVLHVAGIAHQKETKENASLYYEVNRDLAIEVAKKAKKENVKQFIFVSTMSVYGIETGVIDESTRLNPKTHYGKSKKEAEEGIQKLETYEFKVAIVRPPMIYGKNCPGNYQKLKKLVLKLPVFPDINNERSMIYIDNLSEFIKYQIDEVSVGLFFPQNMEYVSTSGMVKSIAEVYKRKIIMVKILNPLIRLSNVNIVNKVFGNLVYKKSLSGCLKKYNITEFKESIYKTHR